MLNLALKYIYTIFYEQVGRMIIPFSKLRCKNVRVPSRVPSYNVYK